MPTPLIQPVIMPAVQPSPLPVVAADSFSRADAVALGYAETGHAWVVLDGVWAITGGKVQQTAAANSDHFVVVNMPTGNIAVEAVVRHSAIGVLFFGLAFRGTDVNNLMVYSINSGASRIYKRDASVWTQIASTPFTGANNVDYLLRVAVVDNTIKAYRDGVLIHTYTLVGDEVTKYAPSKVLAGLHTNETTTRHDNFKVEGA